MTPHRSRTTQFSTYLAVLPSLLAVSSSAFAGLYQTTPVTYIAEPTSLVQLASVGTTSTTTTDYPYQLLTLLGIQSNNTLVGSAATLSVPGTFSPAIQPYLLSPATFNSTTGSGLTLLTDSAPLPTSSSLANTGSYYAITPKVASSGDGIVGTYTELSSVLSGTVAWYQNGSNSVVTPIALPAATAGGSYTYTNSTGAAVQVMTPTAVNNGYAYGFLARYEQNTPTTGTLLGDDDFIYSAGPTPTTTPIGLFDATHSYTVTVNSLPYTYRSGGVSSVANQAMLNASGEAIGNQMRYLGTSTTFGQDPFLYNGTAAYQIGIASVAPTATTKYAFVSGGNVTQSSTAVGISPAGTVAGTTVTYNSGSGQAAGQEAWVYAPGSSTPATSDTYGGSSGYTQIGLFTDPAQGTASNINTQTGSATFTTTVIGHQTAGLISGTGTNYINNAYYNGLSNTNIKFFNANGHAAGTSYRYAYGTTPGNALYGADAWYYDGASTTLISPTASIYTQQAGSNIGASTNAVTAMSALTIPNSKDYVAGYSTRYDPATGTSRGQDAWVYDAADGTVVLSSPTVTGSSNLAPNASGYAYSYIGTLSDSGIAVGYYDVYASSGNTINSYELFAYTAYDQTLTPLANLGNLSNVTSTNLAGALQAYVASFKVGTDGTIYGTTLANSNTTNSTQFNSTQLFIYSLTIPLLLGDANNDGKVDLSDLNIVLNHLGVVDNNRADGNFDGAATIDLTDLNDVLNNLGTSVNPSTVVATPEPAGLSLLAIGGLLLARRHRSRVR